MASKLTLGGADWQALLDRHRREVSALKATNRSVSARAQADARAILDRASAVMDDCRRLERRTLAFEDAAERLSAAGDRLSREADAIPDGMFAGVAHRLVSPFTTICSLAEILRDNPDLALDRRISFLDMAIKDAIRLTEAIDQIVDFARIRSGRLRWRIGAVAVADVVADAVGAIEPLFRDKGVTIEVALSPRLPSVRADRHRAVQVTRNLLINAARFCEAGKGHARVAAALDADAVRVTVSDDGPGIAPERQGIIFARFLDVDDTLDDEPSGVGVGLALAKRIIEHLGGDLWVDSAPGLGSRFSFTLPVAPVGDGDIRAAETP